MNIAPLDWAILAAGFLFFLGWAIYLNTKCRSVADYLVSGRKVRMWLGMGAGIGGEIGLISIAAMCEQGYTHGFSFVVINLLSLVIVIPLFGVYGFGIERFRATKAMSVPQYIEMRYSKNLRIITGITNCLAGVLQMCIFPIGGAMFVRRLLNAPDMTNLYGFEVHTDWVLMFILLVCPIIFTTLGGYTTLIVTNFFQGMLIMLTMTWLFGHLVVHAHNPPQVMAGIQSFWSGLETNLQSAGLNPFANNPDAYGWQWFSFLMLMTILLQFSYGPYLQQYASMDKPKTVSRSYLLGGIFGFGRGLLVFGLGVAAVAAMGTGIPADLSHLNLSATGWARIATPYYVAHVGVPTVLMGLLLVGLLFADVAVTDKYILSWSTSIVNDCIYPFRPQPFTPKQHILAVRITILILCVLFFLFGLIYKPDMTLWSFMWLTSNLIGGSGIAVLLGMYWRGAKTMGAYACIAVCVALPIADVITRQVMARTAGGPTLPWTPEQTGLYTYLIGAVLMIVFSLLSREKSKYWDLGVTVREMNKAAQ